MIKVAINGFGRIGRSFFRALAAKDSNIQVVAINDLDSITQLAHLLKYDTAFGRFTSPVEAKKGALIADGQEIAVYQERDPAKLPWKALNVDVVLESTGVFTDGKKAQLHLDAGAKKVLISAPGTNVDLTLVQGLITVNTNMISTTLFLTPHVRLTVWLQWLKCCKTTLALSPVL